MNAQSSLRPMRQDPERLPIARETVHVAPTVRYPVSESGRGACNITGRWGRSQLTFQACSDVYSKHAIPALSCKAYSASKVFLEKKNLTYSGPAIPNPARRVEMGNTLNHVQMAIEMQWG